MDPVSLLIWLLVLAVAVGVGAWIVRQTVPAQWQWIALLVIGVVALIVLLQVLGVLDGGAHVVDLD